LMLQTDDKSSAKNLFHMTTTSVGYLVKKLYAA